MAPHEKRAGHIVATLLFYRSPVRRPDCDLLVYNFNRRSVNDDLSSTLHNGRGGIPDIDDGICPQGFRFLNHPFGGKSSCIIHHFIICLQFSPHQRLKPLGDIFPDMLGVTITGASTLFFLPFISIPPSDHSVPGCIPNRDFCSSPQRARILSAAPAAPGQARKPAPIFSAHSR